jgi:drug/metabolite transporter (DMT)-like permease
MLPGARPPTWVIHTVLFLVLGVGLGVGTVVGKIGLADVDPIVFATYRDGAAAPLLLAWSARAEGSVRLERSDRSALAFAALFMFLSNLCFTLGVKLSNAVLGAAWQCSVPICTAGAAIALGWEVATPLKLGGIALAFAGSAFILFFRTGPQLPVGAAAGQAHNRTAHNRTASSGGGSSGGGGGGSGGGGGGGLARSSGGGHSLEGNLLFLINVCSFSAYCLATRPLLRKYPPLLVAGLTAALVTVLMLGAALLVHAVPGLARAEEDAAPHEEASPWAMDGAAVMALCYFTLVFGVLLYATIAWANSLQVAPSTVMAYSVFQPVAAALLSVALVRGGFNEAPGHADVQLAEPGWNALGALGVMAGLAMVVRNDLQGGGRSGCGGAGGGVGRDTTEVTSKVSRYRPIPQHESTNSIAGDDSL